MEEKHEWIIENYSNTPTEHREEEKREKKKPIIDIEVSDKPLWAAAV